MEARNLIAERVLVVDDDLSLCHKLGEVLTASGYQPIICTHPRDALIVSKQENFVLAFLDLALPEISGLELAATLKQQDPLREIVFITGHGTFDNAVQAIKMGAVDYLSKPFRSHDLNLCLKRFQERRALKEKARKAEQRYFHLVQDLPLLVYAIRRDYHLEFVNQTCTTMLGYTPEEAASTPNWFLERIHPDDRERVRKSFELAFNSAGSPFSTDCRLNHKMGHFIHAIIRSIGSSQSATVQSVDRLEGIILDITERVFLENALVQREKLKTLGTISAEVVHEIRNPLVAIGGFAQRLQRRFPGSAECNIILSEVQRLEKMLGRIRNYLKPIELNQQGCSVNTLIHQCLDLLSPEMDQRRVACRLDLDEGLYGVSVDPDMIKQVFINLIRNASDAMQRGGTLIIKTHASGEHLHIDFVNQVLDSVKDPELLFLPVSEGGQSIGLPLCYQLVKKMGGVLSFTMEKDRAVFTISLPKTGRVSNAAEWHEPFHKAINRADKRLYPRVEVSWPCTLRTAVKCVEGTVRNISAVGAFISCQNPLTLSETIQTVIQAPRCKSLSVTSQVARSSFTGPSEKHAAHGIGVRFIEISSEGREIIHELITGNAH